ncbi:unnamed protein product [Didymodactylos carnosus]|uniref:Protease Do-like PDZ domain-containing protein n=1 Tax=Didymodactylos carnosus TaxID=1234261 RepID=A0A815E0N2_9BILA|nr:unnamed protein product [Didymodactylos carnosus]CAF1305045.1 unnamed protein product [Didymodactylos carnosus]CAF3805173.1 unnamed protein product [Didymodactylos carnosus]CAF4136628.1 unnamed protein product [Didymodactylos carnosus]
MDESSPILLPLNDRHSSWLETEEIPTFSEQQCTQLRTDTVESFDLLLTSVVKIFCTDVKPNYSVPWQMKSPTFSTSSGFVIRNNAEKRWILGNAHGVSDATNILIRKNGDVKKYLACVLHISHEADLALLTVHDQEFWYGLHELKFGDIPRLQEAVIVIGFPTGGDNLCVTKGVVSRVVVSTYQQSYELLLQIQIDAAINSGNSGGPCLQSNNFVVGVAFQSKRERMFTFIIFPFLFLIGRKEAQSCGYIIPVPVILHFLDEIQEHGRYIGYPQLALRWSPLENDYLKDYLHIPRNKHGILVNYIDPVSNIYQVLKENDVIISIDNVPIGDDGTIYFRRGERISFRFLEKSKFIGNELSLSIIRNGQEMIVKTILDYHSDLVPYQLYDSLPQYLIFGGLVFTPLTKPFITSSAVLEDWYKYSYPRFENIAGYLYHGRLQQSKSEQIILLCEILVDQINNGYVSKYSCERLRTVNDIEVRNMKELNDVIEAETNREGVNYLKFIFDYNKIIVLSIKDAKEAEQRILKRNNISHSKSQDLRHY